MCLQIYWLPLVAVQSDGNSFVMKIKVQFDMDSKIEIDYRIKRKSVFVEFSKVERKEHGRINYFITN